MKTNPFLALAIEKGNPVVDGETATFLWQGRAAPRLIDDLSDWNTSPRKLERIAPGLWAVTLTLPLNAYFEYAFRDPRTGEHLSDPLNPKRVSNGMGKWNNYFYMPKGKPSPYADRNPAAASGDVTRHEVPTGDMLTGKTRTVYLYRPPVSGAVPLLVVYDGPDYLKRGRLNVIVDNLIARGRVRPFAMALVQNGRQARTLEYACSDITLGFLMEKVLPLAKEHLDLVPPEGGAYGVLGASLGGLMALYTGMRLPQVFGKVLSQSGGFSVLEFEFVLSDLVRHLPRLELNIWMDVGRFEWLLAGNQEMHMLLEAKGYNVAYREFSGGHNYTAWRDDVARGLEMLFK
jgi:enterochelin esterase-like enzyme